MPRLNKNQPLNKRPLGEVLSFMRLLWAVTQGVESRSKRMRTELGVTGPQRLVLRIVGHFAPIFPGDVAKILHVDPSSLTGVLHRLESAGFLRRRRDPADGRRALLTLSATGKRLNARHEGTVELAVRRTLSGVSKTQLKATGDLLKALAKELAS
jgi:MarR family transcriptional regulator, organic hydroperoxide resistance regulator